MCAEHFLIFNSEIATENWAILIKRWGISFEDAVENPNHRIEAANIIMHPQYEVNIVFFFTFCCQIYYSSKALLVKISTRKTMINTFSFY